MKSEVFTFGLVLVIVSMVVNFVNLLVGSQ